MKELNPGLMQDFTLNIPTLLEHAAVNHAATEVVARQHDGSVFCYTYNDLARRSRQAANALLGLGVTYGDVVGTLAWNHHWHMECFYAIPGIGAVCHTVNPRLFEAQIVYIINHAQDKVLMVDQDFVELAQRIESQVRASDVAARYGGEEFVVLLPNTQVSSAQLLAERIREAIAATLFDLPNGETVAVTVSIGISEVQLGADDTGLKTIGDSLVARADVALYAAKSAGRNQVMIEAA